MDFFRYRSSKITKNKIWTGSILVILSVITASCVARQATMSERVRESGLDESGRPIAYQVLPKVASGEVDWVASIAEGILDPQSSLDPDSEISDKVLDLDILFPIGKGYPIPNAIFPHKPHTLWLSCNNCHPVLFSMKQGENPVSMDGIIKGEFCGRCHGVVAFPISDCFRCHSDSMVETDTLIKTP